MAVPLPDSYPGHDYPDARVITGVYIDAGGSEPLYFDVSEADYLVIGETLRLRIVSGKDEWLVDPRDVGLWKVEGLAAVYEEREGGTGA